MAWRTLSDGLQRMGAILALLAAALFVALAQPAEARLAPDGVVAVASADHAADLDGGHHPPGAHCASHCTGHATDPAGPAGRTTIPARPLRYPPAHDLEPEALSAAPPTRPPAP